MFLSVVFSFLFHLVTALVPAAAHAAASGDFAGLIDIGGGRKMYLECRGTGSPTVVLVGRLGIRPKIGALPINPRPQRCMRCLSSRGSVPATGRVRQLVRSRAEVIPCHSRSRRGMRSPICMPC